MSKKFSKLVNQTKNRCTVHIKERIPSLPRHLKLFIKKDEDRDVRIVQRLCPYHFYAYESLVPMERDLPPIRCNNEGCDGEVNKDPGHFAAYCDWCSNKYHMCSVCGADLDLKMGKAS